MAIERIYGLKLWQIILLMLALAFALRAGRAAIVDNITKDGVLYVRMAEHLQSGDRTTAFCENRRMPPLYFFLTERLSSITGVRIENTALWISIISGTLLIIPFFLVVRIFFGGRPAAISTLIMVVHPSMVRISSVIMRDSLFLFLYVSAFFLLVCAIRSKGPRSHLWMLIAGAFTALAAFVRSEGAELMITFFVWFAVYLFLKLRRREFSFSLVARLSIGALLFILMFALASYCMLDYVRGTASEWFPLDRRIASYFHGILHVSPEEILKKKERL